MKAGAKPELSAKWWKANRGKAVKDAGLEAALEKYERADLFLRGGENDMAYKAVIDSLKTLAPAVTKQIAACSSGLSSVLQKETIDALKKYEPLIKQTWAEVHRDSAKYKDRIAQVQEMFDKGKLAIETEAKKVKPAEVEADRLIRDFPAACKKGKGKKAKADLKKHATVLEELSEKLDDLEAMLGNLKKLQKQIGVDGEVTGDPMELSRIRSEAVRDCEAKLTAVRRTLAEFSDSDLDGLDATYLKKQKAIIPVIIGLVGQVNNTLGAVREMTKHLSKIPDEKTAAKRLGEIAPHLEEARRLRTQVNSTLRDLREFDDDDSPTGRALSQAKTKLEAAPEKVQQIEDVCRDYKRALEERVEELRRLATEALRKQKAEQQRDAEANQAATEYKKLAVSYVAKAKGWTAKAKDYESQVNKLVADKDADGAAALVPMITTNRRFLAEERNKAGEIVNIDLPKSKLKQKELSHQHLVFAKLTTELDNAYLKLDQLVVELRKIPGVLGRA
jgi:hypothetical protein